VFIAWSLPTTGLAKAIRQSASGKEPRIGTDAMRAVAFIVAIAALFLAGAASPRSAQAQNEYPSRPVSLIVPYAAGGVADVAMRMLGDKLSSRLGQQFVIENRPGAGGIVAAQAAASAASNRCLTMFLPFLRKFRPPPFSTCSL